MTQDELSNLLLDLYDIRNALPAEVLAMPKDSEGSEFTVADLLDDGIAMLEQNTMTATGWTCPHCGRVYDDIDGPPCPSDDCPSHEGEKSAEMTPHERVLFDALRDLLSATQRVYDNRHEYDTAMDAVEMVRLAKGD